MRFRDRSSAWPNTGATTANRRLSQINFPNQLRWSLGRLAIMFAADLEVDMCDEVPDPQLEEEIADLERRTDELERQTDPDPSVIDAIIGHVSALLLRRPSKALLARLQRISGRLSELRDAPKPSAPASPSR
jgi:hypothetical protein